MTEFAIPMDDIPREYTKLDESKLYVFRITSVEVRKTGPQSKNPGEPMLLVHLEVRIPEEFEGKSVNDNLLLPMAPSPLDSVAERRRKAERGVRLRQFMEAAELKWTPQGFSTDDWVGAEIGGTIRNEEGQNGDTFSRPRRYMPASTARDAIAKTTPTPGDTADSPGVSSAPSHGQGI